MSTLPRWETIKCRIGGTSVRYSAKIKRQNNKLLKDLEDRLHTLQQDLPNKSELEAEMCVRVITKLQGEIEEFIAKKNMGVKIRSKTRFYEEWEKSTRFFHSLEKKTQ